MKLLNTIPKQRPKRRKTTLNEKKNSNKKWTEKTGELRYVCVVVYTETETETMTVCKPRGYVFAVECEHDAAPWYACGGLQMLRDFLVFKALQPPQLNQFNHSYQIGTIAILEVLCVARLTNLSNFFENVIYSFLLWHKIDIRTQ